ncbi:Structural maintenance of chromosomes protein 2-2 [Glycine soja]|uniref:Structural maintenance of chromosomes protein 2-2 n=1 Tax=Glycine soja TaxID=3848 RepID=A0A445F1N0_GLYSO|nr:Structural maintenance of chromosomes protein 2-2 [Glycine soja]
MDDTVALTVRGDDGGPLAANIFVATSKSKDACINNSGLMSLSCSHIEAFSTEYYQGLVEEGLQQLTTVIMNHGKERKKVAAEEVMSRKTISLYDITANDNPGSLLMQVQLKGKNFDEWACSLRSALKNLWEELGNHVQIPAFTCGGCTCNLASKLEKKLEEEKIHQFLMGLDKTVYGTVRSNMLAQDPLPKRPHGRGKAEKGRTYGARGCGAVSKANAAQASTSEPKPNIVITDADKSAVSGLDAEQWQTLVNLLNDVKIGLVEKLTDITKVEFIVELQLCSSSDFGSIFSTLLPGTMAKLEPPEGCSFLDGLEVHVAFGSVWKQSLSGLSGG